MRILVTGGAGYIGSHTVLALLDAGYDVLIADNFVNSKPEVLNRLQSLSSKPFSFEDRSVTVGTIGYSFIAKFFFARDAELFPGCASSDDYRFALQTAAVF